MTPASRCDVRRLSAEVDLAGVEAHEAVGRGARAARRRRRCRRPCPRRPPSGPARRAGRRARGGRRASVGRLGQPALQRGRATRPAPPRARRPSVAARARSSAGSAAGSTAALRPMPSTAQPSCGRASTRIARELAAVEQHVVGPLHPRGGAGDVGDREARAERQQRVRVAQDEREQQRLAGGREPGPALPPAPRRLLARGHERAVRRARRGERPGAVVRRPRRPQVQPRAAERAHAGASSTRSPAREPERGRGVAAC